MTFSQNRSQFMRQVSVLMILILGSGAGEAASQTVKTVPNVIPLQAEVETIYRLTDGTLVRTSARYYRSSLGQTREESPLGAVIVDVPSGTITMLIAETKEARVITIPPEQRVRPARSNRPLPEILEETTIEGNRVSKVRTEGPQGQKIEVWTAPDLGIALRTRTEVAGAVTTKEFRNVSREEPKPDLFSVPADYTIIQQAIPGEHGRPGLPTRPAAPVIVPVPPRP
jgi:hypothetical protein